MPAPDGPGRSQVPHQRLLAAILTNHAQKLPWWRWIARQRIAHIARQLAGGG